MIVLDYLRPLEKNTLVIPPFHSGHLGFVPETDVRMGIISGHSSGALELIISPFDLRHHMARLVCTMRDEQGVVGRLVRAVSKLGINIVTQESSSFHSLKYHRVNMLLDWNTTRFDDLNKRSSLADQTRYRKFVRVVPTHLHYYLVLFESIIEHCGDVLWFNEFGEGPMPSMAITPLSSMTGSLDQLMDETRVPLKRGDKSRVNILLPQETINFLKNRLRLPADERPHYLLASDTESKTLRAFFPAFKDIRRLVHLGFTHQDEPGALDCLLEMIRRADFFVITSLLRQGTHPQNSWEVILQYLGDDDPPLKPPQDPSETMSEELCRWAAQKLVSAACGMDDRAVEMLSTIRVELGLPQYPRDPKNPWKDKIPLDFADKSRVPTDVRSWDPSEAPPRFAREVKALKDLMRDARSSRQRPKVFLSYSEAGAHAADHFRNQFKEVEFMSYHDHDGKPILPEVIERIKKCDGFIGIWWHEDAEGSSTSPWLPFEYGLATANGTPSLIVHSRELKERVWKRVEPGVAAPVYGGTKTEALSAVENFIQGLLQ